MPRQLLTIEQFRSAEKAGRDSPKPDEVMLVRAVTGAAEDAGERRKRFVFSDGSVDRAGDTIAAAGWRLDNYQKNPIALFGHNSADINSVIGRAVNVGIQGNKLIGDIDFATADVNPCAETAFRMVEAGLLNAVSVGFDPIDYDFSTDKDRPYGIDFLVQELLEISLVPVPCNANALIIARGKGIDTGPIAEWAMRILDGEGNVSIPRDVLEEVFRVARSPAKMRAKYLNPRKVDGSDWRMGAARDLPIDTSQSWDGSAAAMRMLDAAGFNGLHPDSAAARRGFLLHDAAHPTLRQSYKLPFADIMGDGLLKAVAGGVRAAGSRLLSQTDAPQAVLAEAKAVLVAYTPEDKAPIKGAAHALVKDLDNCAWLASLLGQLARLEDWVDWETEVEEDNSPIGDRLTAVLQTLGQILIDMTAEEVGELLAGEDSDASDPYADMFLAASTPGQKVLIGLAKLARAGAAISQTNMDTLQQALDYHKKASDCVSSVMGSNAGTGSSDGGDMGHMGTTAAPVVTAAADGLEVERRKRLAEARARTARAAAA